MNELFKQLLPTALRSGINVFDFWSMTFGEIVDTINAHNENETARVKETAGLNYHLANLIGLSVARTMDKNAKFPTLQEAFPNMFNELVKVQPVQQDWQVMKARLLQYAESHNKKKR